ncbi:MAG: hypothetical protein AAFP99_09330 [Pseudomonadota bacterium]
MTGIFPRQAFVKGVIGALVAVTPAMASDARPFDRADTISAGELVDAIWPFTDRDGVVFCYKAFPFTYIQFHRDWDDDRGYLLDRDGVAQALERTFNQSYLRDDITTEQLQDSIRALHELAREKCGPPYARTATDDE